MRKMILEKLASVEVEKSVKIIYAIESGSRSWGFASADSDYDVRFLYLRPLDQYLRLDRMSDVIDYQLDEVFDINGWDLQKALRLIASSNPTIMEWLTSRIVYLESGLFAEVKNFLVGNYFSPRASVYHYLSMAKNNNAEFLRNKDRVSLKKYLYVLRALLAARWICDNGNQPPILFADLMTAELDVSLKPIVDELLAVKERSAERQCGSHISELDEFIARNLEDLPQRAEVLPVCRNKSWDELNGIFTDFVLQAAGRS